LSHPKSDSNIFTTLPSDAFSHHIYFAASIGEYKEVPSSVVE
jgi:hypothetical protein